MFYYNLLIEKNLKEITKKGQPKNYGLFFFRKSFFIFNGQVNTWNRLLKKNKKSLTRINKWKDEYFFLHSKKILKQLKNFVM